MQSMNFIAILGFAKTQEPVQAEMAEEAARELCRLGYGVGVGNVSGTLACALRSAKANNGITMAIIEQNLCTRNLDDCDILQVVRSQEEKHEALAKRCTAALIIGGGHGTLKLADKFLQEQKPLIAIANSGGIVPEELNEAIVLSPNVDSAIRSLSNQQLLAS